jgi:hypothetical protein
MLTNQSKKGPRGGGNIMRCIVGVPKAFAKKFGVQLFQPRHFETATHTAWKLTIFNRDQSGIYLTGGEKTIGGQLGADEFSPQNVNIKFNVMPFNRTENLK